MSVAIDQPPTQGEIVRVRSRRYLVEAVEPESIATELCRLSAEGLAPAHMALLLEIAADAAEHRLARGVPVSLVWTGPESAVSQSRDTAVVVEELFAHAETFVLVSSYVVQKGTIVFRSLAERMVARPGLHVQLFLHIGREWRDARDESELLREFGAELAAQWLRQQFDGLVQSRQVRRLPGF